LNLDIVVAVDRHPHPGETLLATGYAEHAGGKGLNQAVAAARAGADVCGVGPMFTTTTKHKDVIVGPSYLRDYLAHCAVPHLAIGGITPETLPRLVDVGVRGIAVSHAVCAAADPGAVVARLLGLMGPSAAAP
ncbi:MAG: thiamine phosphate synthase, partial [Phycisphaerales bacterium]|nr:thiamine phosphate synthase [Phycisphaerales bacterium]